MNFDGYGQYRFARPALRVRYRSRSIALIYLSRRIPVGYTVLVVEFLFRAQAVQSYTCFRRSGPSGSCARCDPVRTSTVQMFRPAILKRCSVDMPHQVLFPGGAKYCSGTGGSIR